MKRGRIKYSKAQVGIEYMIIVGFITFSVIVILFTAIAYSDKIKDKIRLNQVENFAEQLLNSAESVYFAGEPSKTTIRLYLPEGVSSLEITPTYLIITTRTSSGENRRAFSSKVPISGTISTSEGIKKLTLEATEDYLVIS